MYGDKVRTPVDLPEKYTKTMFGYSMSYELNKSGVPVPKRVCNGPEGQETIYTLPFNEENLRKLYNLRESDNTITFTVMQEGGLKYQVKPQKTAEDTFKLFLESDFEYLYTAGYMSLQDKIDIRHKAEAQGLAVKLTDEERIASLKAIESSYQKDKQTPFQ